MCSGKYAKVKYITNCVFENWGGEAREPYVSYPNPTGIGGRTVKGPNPQHFKINVRITFKVSRAPIRNNSDEIILEYVELRVHEISIFLQSQIPTESGKE